MGAKVNYRGTYDDVEALAIRLRKLALEKMPKPDLRTRDFLEWIVKKCGGRIEVESKPGTPASDSGSLEIRDRGCFVIRLSPFTSPLRDNFTIAHELGHYFLHFDPDGSTDGPVVFERYGSDISEWEANRFAAALLMPRPEFNEVFRKTGGDLYAVAGHFGVSVQAAEIRSQYGMDK